MSRIYDTARNTRALTQRILLTGTEVLEDGDVEFSILGSTGTPYTVMLCHDPSCSCPDFTSRQVKCKHILFVLRRVLCVSESMARRNFFSRSEIEQMLKRAPTSVLPPGSHAPPEKVKVAARPIQPDDQCPICYESMRPGETFVYCNVMCGNNIHQGCYERWFRFRRDVQGLPTPECPMCRQPWEAADWDLK